MQIQSLSSSNTSFGGKLQIMTHMSEKPYTRAEFEKICKIFQEKTKQTRGNLEWILYPNTDNFHYATKEDGRTRAVITGEIIREGSEEEIADRLVSMYNKCRDYMKILKKINKKQEALNMYKENAKNDVITSLREVIPTAKKEGLNLYDDWVLYTTP